MRLVLVMINVIRYLLLVIYLYDLISIVENTNKKTYLCWGGLIELLGCKKLI